MDFRDKINLLEKIDKIEKTENDIKSMETQISSKSNKLSKMKEEEVYVKFGELYHRLSQVQSQENKLHVKVVFNARPNADIEALKKLLEDDKINVNIQISGHNKDFFKDYYCSLTFPNFKAANVEDGTTPKDYVKFKKYDDQRYFATIDLEDLKKIYIPVNVNNIKNSGETMIGVLARCNLIDRYEFAKLVVDNADLQNKDL